MGAPQWKLRRLATRAQKVFTRHRAIPSVGAYASSLLPEATGFIANHGAVQVFNTRWKREMAEGRGAMATLLGEINQWKPHVARSQPTFELSTIGDRPDVPEDLIEDGERLADALELIRGADGTVSAEIAAGVTALRAKADAAERETGEAADADATWAGLLATLRAQASTFEAELSRFRQTLKGALGRAHPDFQKLRTEKVLAADEDDEVVVTPPVVG